MFQTYVFCDIVNEKKIWKFGLRDELEIEIKKNCRLILSVKWVVNGGARNVFVITTFFFSNVSLACVYVLYTVCSI